MWNDRQIPGWPQFHQQWLLPSMPSLVDFKCAIIFRSFHLDFLCANLAVPIISYRLFSNLRCSRHMIHPGNCSPAPSSVSFNCPFVQSFLKASSSSFRLQIRPLWPLRTIFFQNFSRHAYAPPLKTLLAPSPDCFNYSIIFWKPPPRAISCQSAHANRSGRRRRDSLPTLLIAAQERPAQDATGSQEASVSIWNSRILLQFGESRARDSPLPRSLNWGPAVIYRSGQTGIGSWVGRLCFHEFYSSDFHQVAWSITARVHTAKVHAVPLTLKFWYRPRLSRSLSKKSSSLFGSSY